MTLKSRLLLFLSLFFLSGCRTYSIPPEESGPTVTESFISEIAPIAKEIQDEFGILPSIIMGQAILESDSGQSELGRAYNNLFGIKAYSDEEQVVLSTSEFVDDTWITIDGTFKVYPDWRSSIQDHALLLVHGVTWNENLYQPVVEATTHQEAAKALQSAGYATDPDYSDKVIAVIEQYELTAYD